MAILSKVFLVITLIACIAAGVFGFMLNEKLTKAEGGLESVEKALRSSTIPELKAYQGDFRQDPSDIVKVIRSADASHTALVADKQRLEGEVAAKVSELQTATRRIDELIQEKSGIEAQISQLTASAKAVEEQLNATKSALEEMQRDLRSTGYATASAIKADLDRVEGQRNVLQREKELLDTRLADLTRELAEKNELIANFNEKRAPLELSGKVVEVNRAWNFVVLDVGLEQKLTPGVSLTVYRGDQFVGKVKTVSVEENLSVADVLPEWQKMEIQVGDQVLF